MQSAWMTLMFLTLANDGAAATPAVVEADPQIGLTGALEELVDRRWVQPPRSAAPLPADAAEIRARLGSRRSRELREANFHCRRFELDPGRDLADDPIAQERVEEILFDGFVKLVRKAAENALDLDRRVERLRPRRFRSPESTADSSGARRGFQRGFELSPNLWLGHDLAYGFEVSPRTAHPIWSRTELEIRQHTESEAFQVRFKYARGDRLFMLEHRRGDPIAGDSFGLLLRTTF